MICLITGEQVNGIPREGVVDTVITIVEAEALVHQAPAVDITAEVTAVADTPSADGLTDGGKTSSFRTSSSTTRRGSRRFHDLPV